MHRTMPCACAACWREAASSSCARALTGHACRSCGMSHSCGHRGDNLVAHLPPAATLLASGSGISTGGCSGKGARSGSGGSSGGGTGGRSGAGPGGGGSGCGGTSGGGCGDAGSGLWPMPLLRSTALTRAARSPHSTRPPGVFSHDVAVPSSTSALGNRMATLLKPARPTHRLDSRAAVSNGGRLIVLMRDLPTWPGVLSLCPGGLHRRGDGEGRGAIAIMTRKRSSDRGSTAKRSARLRVSVSSLARRRVARTACS
jgi:hypothetical protein